MYNILLSQLLLFSFPIAKIHPNSSGTVFPTYNNTTDLEINHIDNHAINNNEIYNNETISNAIDYNKTYINQTDYTYVDNNEISQNETNNNEIDNNNVKYNYKIYNNGTDDYEKVSNKTYHNETDNYEIDNNYLNKNDIDSPKINIDERNNNEIKNNTTYNNDTDNDVIDTNEMNSNELDYNNINKNETDSNEVFNNETNKTEIYNNHTVNNETYKNGINNNKTDNQEIDNNEIDSNGRDIIEIEEDTCKLSVIPPNPNSMCCGVDLSSSNRIVGGKPAGINQYPWMAIIFERSKKTGTLTLGCGGALISSLYVLTAAHCFASYESDDIEPYIVDLGDHDIDHDGPDCVITRGRKICSDGETIIRIAMTISHPMFDIDKSEAHDVALIKLASMAPYTDGIRPICLPTFDINKSSQNNLWLYIAGWGTMQEVRKGNELKSILSSVKRHVHVPFIHNQKCNQSVTCADITTNQVCAGGLKNRGSCTGDSGGPLMFNNGGQFEVTGVVSFGPNSGCGQKGKPDVFTNIFRYKEWIFDVINKGIAESKE